MPFKRGPAPARVEPADEATEDAEGHKFTRKVKPADEAVDDTEAHRIKRG